MSIVPPIPPFGPFHPVGNVTPFTTKDGDQYLSILWSLRNFINNTIIPYIEAYTSENAVAIANLVEELRTSVNNSITQLELNTEEQLADQDAKIVAQLAAQAAAITAQINQQNVTANQQFTAFTNNVNAILLDLQNESIDFSDPVLDTIINDVNSASRRSLNNTYADSYGFVGTEYVQIGDSWWPETFGVFGVVKLAPIIGLNQHNYAVPGSGWQQAGNGNSTFVTQIDAAIADATYDHNHVALVVLGSGVNDTRTNKVPADCAAIARTQFARLRAAFPNARIVWVTLNKVSGHIASDLEADYVTLTSRAALETGVEVINDMSRVFFGRYDDFNGDGLHPSAAGGEALSYWLAARLRGVETVQSALDTYVSTVADNADASVTCNVALNGMTMYAVISITQNVAGNSNVPGTSYLLARSLRFLKQGNRNFWDIKDIASSPNKPFLFRNTQRLVALKAIAAAEKLEITFELPYLLAPKLV